MKEETNELMKQYQEFMEEHDIAVQILSVDKCKDTDGFYLSIQFVIINIFYY